VNQREIRRLADLLREYGLTEVEVEREGVRVRAAQVALDAHEACRR